MGDFEVRMLVPMESTLKYHPCYIELLTCCHYLARGQCVVGSLTGAVASQRVTEAFKVTLSTVRNRIKEHKGRSVIDCETYKSSRCESRT